jgi:hypothetical protein
MVIEIVARFNFYARNLSGRAYIFNSNFEETYRDLTGAFAYMGEVTRSNELDSAREKKFSFVNAIMWGTPTADKMIDFFGVGPNHSLLRDDHWADNPDVYSWIVKNGVIVPKESISEITCGKGIIVMGEEEKYRLRTRDYEEYTKYPPKIRGKYTLGDICILNGTD